MVLQRTNVHFIGFQEKGLHLNRANYGVGALIFSVSSFLLLDYLHHTSSPPINPLIFKNYSLLSSGVEVGLCGCRLQSFPIYRLLAHTICRVVHHKVLCVHLKESGLGLYLNKQRCLSALTYSERQPISYPHSPQRISRSWLSGRWAIQLPVHL